jgi:hypothetical protein
MIQYNPIVSGSLIVSGSVQVIGGEVNAPVNYDNITNKPTLISGSSQITYANINSIPAGIVSGSSQLTSLLPTGVVSGSIQVLGGTGIWSGSAQLPTGVVSGSSQVLGGTSIVSGSTQILGLGFVTGSYVTINEYNYLTQSFNIISASVVTIENDIDAGIYATTGSNTFIGTQIITGSTYIRGDLIVQGSSSLENITASAVSIGTNIVYLNTDTPAVRFAGLSVFDSGSTAGTGSLLYDSENERWVYQKASGSSYSGGMLISGPRNNGALGDEVGMPTNKLIMGIGGDHISSSNIYHNGTDTAFAGNLEVTGSTILATATITTLNAGNGVVSGSSQVVGILSSLNTYTGSNDTTNTAQNSRLTTIESVTGSYETKGRGIVSGSSQIDVMSTTNIARLATTGSNNFSGNQSVTGSGYVIYNLRTLSAGNNSNYQLGNDSTANGSGMALFGSTFTTSGQYRQSGMYVYSNQAGGMTLHAEGANPMYLSTNGTTAITISSAQNATFAGTITENSSIRYKENVETIKYGLDKVLQMRGVTYDKKDNGVREMGVIAEEIYEVLPEVVLKNEEGEIDSVSYGRIVGVLIEAIKDLKKEIEDLKSNR